MIFERQAYQKVCNFCSTTRTSETEREQRMYCETVHGALLGGSCFPGQRVPGHRLWTRFWTCRLRRRIVLIRKRLQSGLFWCLVTKRTYRWRSSDVLLAWVALATLSHRKATFSQPVCPTGQKIKSHSSNKHVPRRFRWPGPFS